MFRGIVSSQREVLSSTQALELANIYLENACKVDEVVIALVLCHDAEISLTQARKAVGNGDDPTSRSGIATAYIELGKALDTRGLQHEAQASYKKAKKWGVRPPTIDIQLPEEDSRLVSTPQLACRLSLLQDSNSLDDIQEEPDVRAWLQVVQNDTDEQERLKTLATDVVRAFKRDEIKGPMVVAEIVCLAPVLDKDDFRYLLMELCKGVEQSVLLDIHPT
ncbi:hypothetical protein BGX31_006852 [Mortierella sp. GBA43]|nr:hypothetical protein BGX31_006852 [Mortierella sp. GBA43]